MGAWPLVLFCQKNLCSQHTVSECGRDTRGVLKEEEDTHLVDQISHGGQ